MSGLPSPGYMAAHANDNRQPIIYGVCAMLGFLATVAVSLRFIARRGVFQNDAVRVGADDYLALLALILFYTLVASTCYVTYHGIGRRFFVLTEEDNIDIAKGFLAFELNYPAVTFTAKLSVLMLYRRLFRMNIKSFAIGWWLNLFYAFAYTVSLIADGLTQCKTVPELWDPNVPPGDCRTGSTVSLYVFAVLNGVSDICILSLPIPIVIKLQMTTRRKIAVLGMFMLGFIVVVISFIRIYSLATGSGSTADPTYDQVDGLIWTIAEPATGIICSCLPVMRPVIIGARDTYRSFRSRSSRSRLYNGDDTEAINDTRPSQHSDNTWSQANGQANYFLSNLERDA